MSATTWTTKDGHKLAWSELDDQHLTNVIYMLRRNAPAYKAKANRSALHFVIEQDWGSAGYVQAFLEMSPREYLETDPTYVAALSEAARRELAIDPARGWTTEPSPLAAR